MIELVELLPSLGEVPPMLEAASALFAAKKESPMELTEQQAARVLAARRPGDDRSAERIFVHYREERAIATRLRAARTFAERQRIASTMYDELFSRVPDHPRLRKRDSARADSHKAKGLEWDLVFLRDYLRPGCTFLEIGAGDCALARRVAEQARAVYAVELCDQTSGALPPNLKVVLSDGRSIPVAAGSVDVAFSDQLMEHLHPEDALEQLRNIHRALRPGGVYLCITPNRLYGPSDVSWHFDDEAPTGFHLHEYTLAEIRDAMSKAGFARVVVYVGARGWFIRFPAAPVVAVEKLLQSLPPRLRRAIASFKPMRALLGLRVAAIKA